MKVIFPVRSSTAYIILRKPDNQIGTLMSQEGHLFGGGGYLLHIGGTGVYDTILQLTA